MKTKHARKNGSGLDLLTDELAGSDLADCPSSQLLNALPHPLLSVAGDGSIRDVNPAAELFFDTSPQRLAPHQVSGPAAVRFALDFVDRNGSPAPCADQ